LHSPRLHRNTTRPSEDAPLVLFDPRDGGLAFKLAPFASGESFAGPQRFNYFTILWMQAGQGHVHVDLSTEACLAPSLIFFNPYQTFSLAADSPVNGMALQFHANFFCIEAYHEAVGCNGVLFNDIYGKAQVSLDDRDGTEIAQLVGGMVEEFNACGLAHTEALVSLLKLFLIKATRLKVAQQATSFSTPRQAPPILQKLQHLLETEFKNKHSPAEYASALHMSPKALGRLVKAHFGKTLTELIRDRMLKHAKWQLLHTQRPMKEIAWELGFSDPLYFSRLFKRATGMSPTADHEFETAIRGGSNLSI